MTMTREETRLLHDLYEDSPQVTRDAIDAAYTACRAALAGICKPANDDRAEKLIAAIFQYYLESVPD